MKIFELANDEFDTYINKKANCSTLALIKLQQILFW